MSKQEKVMVPTWRLACWAFHQSASSFIGTAMGFVSYLATGYYGLAVVAAGMISSWTRLFDGLIDPFLALITDRVNTKYGRLRILIVIGRAIQVLCILTLFFWGIGTGPVLFTIIYSVYYIGASIAAIATHTGNAIITTDPKRRPIIFRWNLSYTLFMSTIISSYMSKVLYPKYGGLNLEAFQELALTSLALVAVMEVIACIAVAPYDRPEMFPKKEGGKEPSLRDTFGVLTKNKAMQMWLLAAVSDKLASNSNVTAFTTLLWGIIIGNYEASGTIGLWQLPFTLAFLWYGTARQGKIGGKKAVIRYTTISIALAVAMFLLFLVIDPTQITKAVVPTAIFFALTVARSAMSVTMNSATQSMLPDIVDYELYRSGSFVPGIIGTTQSLVDELITSLGPTIGAFACTLCGYKDVMPQPGDPCTPTILWVCLIFWLGLPILAWLLNYIAMKNYPLTPELMAEVQEHNKEFREKMAAEKA